MLQEAILKYPEYKFYSNFTRAMLAGTDSRMFPDAIVGTLVDIHMLAICDFIVCTFSSNVSINLLILYFSTYVDIIIINIVITVSYSRRVDDVCNNLFNLSLLHLVG